MKEKLPSVLSSEGPFSPLFLHSPFHPIVSFFPSFPPSHFPPFAARPIRRSNKEGKYIHRLSSRWRVSLPFSEEEEDQPWLLWPN